MHDSSEHAVQYVVHMYQSNGSTYVHLLPEPRGGWFGLVRARPHMRNTGCLTHNTRACTDGARELDEGPLAPDVHHLIN